MPNPDCSDSCEKFSHKFPEILTHEIPGVEQNVEQSRVQFYGKRV